MCDDFRIWFGGDEGDVRRDGLRGPVEVAALVRRHRRAREGLTLAPHGAPIDDVDGRRAALVWTATTPDPQGGAARAAGIDAFDVDAGRFTRCWSVTGGRVLG